MRIGGTGENQGERCGDRKGSVDKVTVRKGNLDDGLMDRAKRIEFTKGGAEWE